MKKIKTKLIIVDGSPASGKSIFQEKVSEVPNSITLQKYSTRKVRDDDTDIIHKSQAWFEKKISDPFFYSYEFGNEFYGFSCSKLNAYLDELKTVSVIVRSQKLVIKIKANFSKYNPISILVISDKIIADKRLRNQGYSDKQIQQRMDRAPSVLEDFNLNRAAYDEVIKNNTTFVEFEEKVDGFVNKYLIG